MIPRLRKTPMRMYIATLAFLVAVFAGVSTASGQDATLRYRWTKGDEVRYRISQQSNTTLSGLPGLNDMSIDQNISQVVRMTVEDITADGNATIRETFESMRLEQSAPTGKVVFDSTTPHESTDTSEAAVAAMMSALVGESITMVIAPSGSVSRIEGMTRILDKAMKSLSLTPGAAVVMNQLKGLVGDDAIRGMFDQSFGIFPDRPLRVGDSWTSQFEPTNPVLGKLTASRTYTLKSIEPRNGASIAHISVTVAMKQGDAPAPGPLGASVRIADTETTGEIVFDATRGRVERTSLRSETPMTLALTLPDTSTANPKALTRTSLTMEIVEK
jgi:hypothetical protein